MAMRNCTYISIFITSLRKVSPTGLQSQIFWGLIFLMQDPQVGGPNVRFRSLTLWGEPLQCNYSLIVGHPLGGMKLDYTVSLPLLPISLWFLSCVFNCRSFLEGSILFFINGYSANGCGFGVQVTGGELRVFLLCHLD